LSFCKIWCDLATFMMKKLLCFYLLLIFWFVDLNGIVLPIKTLNDNFFERYVAKDLEQSRPVWRITNGNYSTIHRFFDSSPFSPSGRYIGLTRFPSSFGSWDSSKIVIVDLLTGDEKVLGSTRAWGSQLGAQVQWGSSDNAILYNVIIKQKEIEVPRGIILDIKTNITRILECPVYHVSSNGLYALAPSMTEMHRTQLGYGIKLNNKNNSYDNNYVYNVDEDGVFHINIQTGKCHLLVSMSKIAKLLGLGLNGTTRLHGFHVKWSSDNELIMFIVRHFEKIPFDKNSIFKKSKTSRVNHIVIMRSDGSNLRYLVSWSSMIKEWNGIPINNGNHPTWVAGTHKITMNTKSANDNGDKLFWDLTIFDTDTLMSLPSGHKEGLKGIKLFERSTGHPQLLPGGSAVLLDTLSKEYIWFGKSTKGKSIIRLVDLNSTNEQTLVNIPVGSSFQETEFWNFRINDPKYAKKLKSLGSHNKILASWRCDAHPAFSRDYSWVALNSKLPNGNRQVLVMHI